MMRTVVRPVSLVARVIPLGRGCVRVRGDRLQDPSFEITGGLIDTRLATFRLGQRDHDELFPPEDWSGFRRRVDDQIEALRR